MLKRKIKGMMALAMSFCIIAQTAMAASSSAGSYTRSESVEILVKTVPAKEELPPKNEEIKTKISREEAQKIAKSFKFSEGYEITGIYLENTGSNAVFVWRIELNASQPMTNMSISISADSGELLGLYTWQNTYGNKKNIAALSKKQALEIAEKFVSDYVKTDTKTLTLMDNYNNAYEKSNGIYEVPIYNFTYLPKINGILASDLSYNIQVNAVNGSIVNFSSPYTYLQPAEYPSADGIKDEAQLKEKYGEMLKMQLAYMITYENNKQKATLVYFPSVPGLLNAKTLEPHLENYPGNSGNVSNNKPMVPGMKPVKRAVTETEAEEMIQKIKIELEKLTGVKFENQENRTSTSLTAEDKQITKSYNVVLNGMSYGFSIAVSLVTGNIVSFSYYSYSNEAEKQKQQTIKEKVGYSEAKKASDELIKKLFEKQYGVFSDINQEPDKNDEIVKQQPGHPFNYVRYENGIPANNSISVSIDKETGKPTQIYMSWNDIDYPGTDKIISAEKAREIYLKNAGFELSYYTPYVYSKDGSARPASERIIVYKPDSATASMYLNAFTGEIIDYSGIKLQSKYADDTHWAANSIELLEIQGIVLNNITGYDVKLAREDAVKMLALTVGIQPFNYVSPVKDSFPDVKKESPYYPYVESAVNNHIIEAAGNNFDGDKIITKQEFIVMLLNTLGYGELVKHPELFVLSGKDSYFALCNTLGILPVKPGEVFVPSDEITFAEAACSLQKALKYFR